MDVFSQSAQLYDLFYESKDYESEAAALAELIRWNNPDAKSLLDVACGTGRHLEYLQEVLECEGVDLDPQLLAIAADRVPGVPLTEADFTDFDLGRRFDAVVCMFSAIGYARTPDRLELAVHAMANHLEPGGLLVIQPWVPSEEWIEDGAATVNEASDGRRKLVRVIASRRDGALSRLRIHYVIADAGEISTADEEHVLGLFSRHQYLDACEKAGLNAKWLENAQSFDRDLIVGTARR